MKIKQFTNLHKSAIVDLKSNNTSSAISKLNQILELRPNDPQIINDLAIAYIKTEKYLTAFNLLNRIISQKYKPALINHFRLAKDLKLYSEALISINNLLSLESNNLNYLAEKLKVLENLNLLSEISDIIKEILKLNPENHTLASYQLSLDQSLCKWNKAKLEELLGFHKKTMVFEPYSFLYLHDNEKIKFEVAKKWVSHKFNGLKSDLQITPKKKISIGYFSANFKNHPTAYLIREVLDNHNLDQFDVHLFSYCNETNEDLHQEFKNKYKNFYDVSHQSIKEILEFARLKLIDIAIDLDGFTKNNRMEIFASKVAPIQIRYLDFLGTTGADFYHYLIADHRVIPESSRKFYSEKIAYMPDCFFIRDTRIPISTNITTKSYYLLPEDHFIFASFNLSIKITEEIFRAWIDILKNTTKTVLWLLIENPLTQKNILDLIKASKINPERIIFASRVSVQEHLSRHQHVDLFLDTSPYNGHSSSSDALWMNVPIITIKGNSFASRVTSSMLISLGLDFLIANDLEEYINLAIKFAKNIKEVKNIKERIKEKKITSNLFNMQLYTKNLEKIYKKALSNKLIQKKPGHILK